MRTKKLHDFLAGIVVSAALLPVAAVQAAVLTFTDAPCETAAGDPMACANGLLISQDYGDIAGVLDVTWDRNRNTATADNVFYWGAGYEELDAVAYGQNLGGGLSILFEALPGWELTVSSFQIAPYLNRVRPSSVRVVADGTELINTGSFSVSTNGSTLFEPSTTWASSFLIELGPDAWDIGISNIAYDWRQVETQAPPPSGDVSLPAPASLLFAGLVMLGLSRRGRS